MIAITGGGVFAMIESSPSESAQTVQTESDASNQSSSLQVEPEGTAAGQLHTGSSLNPHNTTPNPQSASDAETYEAADDPQNPVSPQGR